MKTDTKNNIWETNKEKPKVCGLKREKTWTQKLFFPSFTLGSCYILWRLFFTIDYSNIYNISAGYLLWIAELYSFLMFLSFSYITTQKCNCSCDYTDMDLYADQENQICSIDDETNELSCKNKAFPTVDIFICTYNEGLDILLDTFEGCKNIDYPKKQVYVLDDGRRENIKNTALDYGFKYITRDNNEGYKAGNINNALPQTNGELIVIFDADHIPVKNFLNELIDFFSDEKVALVQTPQHFYNPDPIQKNLKFYDILTNEQDLFFRVLEPSISCSNSTLVAGTNFMIRRQFLEEIGGLPQESITEDMALGIKLQEKGLKVYFHDKPLAAGLAPENYKEYIVQRSRWAKGTIQIFMNEKIKKYLENMDIKQKLPYYAGLLYYMLSIPRLICVIMPAVFLIFGLKPVIATFWPTLFLFQLSYFSMKLFYFWFSANKYRNIVFSDLYELCIWYPLLSEISQMFLFPQGAKKQKFTVTNKGKLANAKNYELSTILPNIILFTICLIAYFYTVPRYIEIEYKPALFINLFWNTYNFIMLALAINVGFEKKDSEEDYRIKTDINALIKGQSDIRAKVINLSKTGAQIITEDSLEINSIITMDFAEFSGINVRVVYSKIKDKLVYTGIKFIDNSKKFQKDVFKLMFYNSEAW